mmetsp:Transcript_1413/g.4075  ORF Transcript_1413/g.4075 Transcript_1413/m.4075 type:complete len:338 (+) Transcript_1413:356-1369(+)
MGAANEAAEQRQQAAEYGVHHGEKVAEEVHKVLQALGTGVIEPLVLVCAAAVVGEGGGVCHLCPDVVKDGEDHAVEDARPEGGAEALAVVAEDVKQHLKGRVANVRPGVEGELTEASEQREPKVHVLVFVSEVQPARGRAEGQRQGGPARARALGGLHLDALEELRGLGRAGLVDALDARLCQHLLTLHHCLLRQLVHAADGSVCELESAKAEEGDGIEGNIQRVRVVGEGDEAIDAVREGGDLRLRDVGEVLPHDLLDGLEGQPHNCLCVVLGRSGKHHEHAFPAGLDVGHTGEHHLTDAPNDKLPDLEAVALPHHHHKWPQEVVLKRVVGELVAL